MTGTKQHYLQAAYLGGFSDAPERPRRRSVVWVASRTTDRPFRERAENLAAERGLYDTGSEGDEDRTLVDDAWAAVESRLPEAIEAVANGKNFHPSADVWLRVLVPFAAQAFVRGIDWQERFVGRFAAYFGRDEEADALVQSAENVNMARLIELELLYAAVMATKWEVLHAPEGSSFVTNDLGRMAMRHDDGRYGYVLPLRRDAALAITRVDRGPMVAWNERDRKWGLVSMEHVEMTEQDVAEMNDAIKGTALNEVYGGGPELVGPLDPERGAPVDAFLDPAFLVPSDAWLHEHKNAWPSLLAITSRPPADEEDKAWYLAAPVDWALFQEFDELLTGSG